MLDSFQNTEFWYAEQGSISGNSSRSGSFRRIIPQPQRKEEKWWLPVPCVPPEGLSEKSRKHLRRQRNCANQIHKAAMAINSSILAEMEIPDTYMDSLPKVSSPCRYLNFPFLFFGAEGFSCSESFKFVLFSLQIQ